MDILNWLFLRKEQLIRKTANNADTDLVAIGADVTFAKRDDRYQTYAMPIKDFSVAGDVANTGYYTLDIDAFPFAVTVNTVKGIIEIINTDAGGGPAENYGSPYVFFIDNPELDLSAGNRDNIYMQYSVYYSPGVDDNAIPYVVATGFVPAGAGFSLYNANPAVANTGNWTGALYVYYELYTK